MSFDAYGLAPTAKEGQQFGISNGGWHLIWDYCRKVAPDLISAELHWLGSGNDTRCGLGGEDAEVLAHRLRHGIRQGGAEEFFVSRSNHAEQPTRAAACFMCGGTRSLTPVGAPLMPGTESDNWEDPLFDAEASRWPALRTFVDFAEASGGFEIE